MPCAFVRYVVLHTIRKGCAVRTQPRSRIRSVVAVFLLILGMTVLVMTVNESVSRQQRLAAAEQLASQQPPVQPSVLPAVTPTPSPSVSSSSPAAATPLAVSAPAPAITYPITGFVWQAAGINVKVVPMAEKEWVAQATTGVDPPLDQHGFDPVGHWLAGTGEGLNGPTPVTIIAAHTCYMDDPSLCNNGTFPFRQLSYASWAAGQSASLYDANGQLVSLVLDNYQVVDKSQPLPIVQDGPGVHAGCYVQVFSCNLSDPHGKITLVTFKRSQCV